MLTAQPLSAAPPPPAPPATVDFQFRDGDRVVMVGNTLVERAQAYGHLETAIVARLSGIRLTFRNLGWSGDTVRAESRGIFDPPAKGYQRMLDHVSRLKPTVLVLGYGSNESFSGDEGIPEFLARYRKLISDLRKRSAPGPGWSSSLPAATTSRPPAAQYRRSGHVEIHSIRSRRPHRAKPTDWPLQHGPGQLRSGGRTRSPRSQCPLPETLGQATPAVPTVVHR
ncbi:MAG: hypothetical protein Ct9H300mP1_36680 [Planctomycetaceae bacterium]|nr:MAG: hypothetical protein Ct9H300mP1_36680 [Planctomycetaceae bacterium]